MKVSAFLGECAYAIRRGEWSAGFCWKLRKVGVYSDWYDCQHRALWLGPFYVCVSY